MTGFASAEVGGDGEMRLTIKGVNHRFLDVSLRLPSGMDALEMRLRRALKERVRRGHVDVTLSAPRRAEGVPRLNEEVLTAYVRALRSAGERVGLGGELELAAMARLPGVFTSEGVGETMNPGMEARVEAAMEPLLAAFDEARAAEGEALAAALRASLEVIRGIVVEARELRGGVRDAHLAKLKGRMEQLLTGAAQVSELRLLSEAALLAERSDVEEELLRLEAHVQSFAATLEAGGELGKRLDFLTQEMNREVNTMLSKTGSAAGSAGLELTELGLACKVEIERMREQVQNVE